MKQSELNQLMAECETLWERFDPLGVSGYSGGVDSEYRGYLRRTVNLVEAAADQYKLKAFVETCVYLSMGLPQTPSRDEAIADFVKELSDLGERL
ncbi:MAG: hypothetical protein ABJL99_08630 [Aliishimia sp.]